jgi:hypothetical protein
LFSSSLVTDTISSRLEQQRAYRDQLSQLPTAPVAPAAAAAVSGLTSDPAALSLPAVGFAMPAAPSTVYGTPRGSPVFGNRVPVVPQPSGDSSAAWSELRVKLAALGRAE